MQNNIVKHIPIILIVVTFLSILGWNLSGFIGADAKMKISDKLNFLPNSAVAKAMSIGHVNTMAKLRWIDSFKFFQYQIDVRDDSVNSNDKNDSRGAFERLYSTLIDMDPKFKHYYYHASLTCSGVLKDHRSSLAFFSRGVMELSDNHQMWMNYLSILKVFYDLETNNPGQMESVLKSWRRNMKLDWQKEVVDAWLSNLGKRLNREMLQADYWLNRLHEVKKGSNQALYIINILQDLLSLYGEKFLQNILKPNFLQSDLQQSKSLELSDLLELDQLIQKHKKGFSPLSWNGKEFLLNNDVYGLPYELRNGKVVSVGRNRYLFEKELFRVNTFDIPNMAKERGSWPKTLEELNLSLRQKPNDAILIYKDRQLIVEYNKSPQNPIDFYKFLK